jgi:hypothetical protein
MTTPTPSKHTERILRRNYLFRFNPQPGITTWEIARFIAILTNDKPLHFRRYLALGPDLQRHFRHIKIAITPPEHKLTHG